MSDKEVSSDKLGWMYRDSNDTVDREEYLLGRRLDKNVDSQSNATTSESIPSSIFTLPECTNRIDLLRKIKEDPLEAIKEKERAMRKELLKNPIQMKKLQKMFEAQKRKDELSRHHETKKKVKKKKKSSNNDRELDALLSQKLAKLIKKYGKDKIFNSDDNSKDEKNTKLKSNRGKKSKYETSSTSSSSSSSESSDESVDERSRKRKEPVNDKKRIKEGSERRENRSKRSSSSESSSADSDNARNKKSLKSKRSSSSDREVQSSKDTNEMRYSKKYMSDNTPPRGKSFGLYVPEGAKKVKNDDSSKASKAQSPPRRPRDRSTDKQGHKSRYERNRRESSSDGEPSRREVKSRDQTRRDSRDRDQSRRDARDRDQSRRDSRDRDQIRRDARDRDQSRRDSRDRDQSRRDSRDRDQSRRGSRDREQIRRDVRNKDMGRRDNNKTFSGKYHERDRSNHMKTSGVLSEQEKEKKLKEMMENVSWRNDLMESNTKRHNELLKKEEKQQEKYDENFAKNQLSKGIYSNTVEKRIKSKIQNIQRSKFDMDKNFARR